MKFPTRLRIAVAVILLAIVIIALAVYLATPPTPTSTPMPTPTPAPPTPTSGPAPLPKLNMSADFASLKGFNVTEMEFQGSLFPVLVLPPGGSGSIPITLISTGDENYTVSLDIGLAGENPKFEGVRYIFSPSTLNLNAGAKASSILSIEVDSDAPTAYYSLINRAHIKEWGGSIGMTFFDLLICPYTPSYAFMIIAPTPGAPQPTPIGTPPPELTPTIAVKPGETVYIMFDIDKGTPDPTVQVRIDLSHDSGSLPPGIGAKFISNPLKVVPAPTYGSLIMLTLTAAEDVPEGTYKMIAKISVGSYTTERSFDLTLRR